MALHRVRSRVRVQNLTKKTKKEVVDNGQGKSTRIVTGGAPERALTKYPVREEVAFAKKRVPSKHELQNLRSNLSTLIAAAKAHGAQRSPCNALGSSSSLVRDVSAVARHAEIASAEHAPSDPVLERAPVMRMSPTGQGTGYKDDHPSVSLLATTAIYRPTAHPIAPVVPDVEAVDGEHDSPAVDATEVAILSESEEDDLSETPGGGNQNFHATCAEPVVCPQEPPHCSRERLSTSTQRVLTLFAGRCRCCLQNSKSPGGTPEPARGQSHVVAPDCSQPKPQAGPGQNPPRPPLRRLRPRHDEARFGAVTPSLPIPRQKLAHIAPNHAPLQHTSLPTSNGVKEQPKTNPYEGCCVVVPDIYQPVEIQSGFRSATPPKASTSPKPKQVLEEGPTVLELWDAHVAQFSKYREAPAVPDDCRELAKHLEALEDMRAERLRYAGHCFGAISGDVYPFSSGLIF